MNRNIFFKDSLCFLQIVYSIDDLYSLLVNLYLSQVNTYHFCSMMFVVFQGAGPTLSLMLLCAVLLKEAKRKTMILGSRIFHFSAIVSTKKSCLSNPLCHTSTCTCICVFPALVGHLLTFSHMDTCMCSTLAITNVQKNTCQNSSQAFKLGRCLAVVTLGKALHH